MMIKDAIKTQKAIDESKKYKACMCDGLKAFIWDTVKGDYIRKGNKWTLGLITKVEDLKKRGFIPCVLNG